jgi:hypothetical protein
MAVMDRDNIVVAKKSPPPKAASTDPAKPSRTVAVCGAMSLQHGDSSNQSSPQKFVRLVGCHESKVPLKVKR